MGSRLFHLRDHSHPHTDFILAWFIIVFNPYCCLDWSYWFWNGAAGFEMELLVFKLIFRRNRHEQSTTLVSLAVNRLHIAAT